MNRIRLTVISVLLTSTFAIHTPCMAQDTAIRTNNALLMTAPRPRTQAVSTTQEIINLIISFFTS